MACSIKVNVLYGTIRRALRATRSICPLNGHGQRRYPRINNAYCQSITNHVYNLNYWRNERNIFFWLAHCWCWTSCLSRLNVDVHVDKQLRWKFSVFTRVPFIWKLKLYLEVCTGYDFSTAPIPIVWKLQLSLSQFSTLDSTEYNLLLLSVLFEFFSLQIDLLMGSILTRVIELRRAHYCMQNTKTFRIFPGSRGARPKYKNLLSMSLTRVFTV